MVRWRAIEAGQSGSPRAGPSTRRHHTAIFARRTGEMWFLAAINGAEAKFAKIPLSFLGPGDYTILELTDDPANRDSIQLTQKRISARDSVNLELTPGGGYVARFSRN